MDFEHIESTGDLRSLEISELAGFSAFLRQDLISKISEQGGHFAANLGAVELTVALHYVYNTPDDVLIWDVGHQSYAHKLITGRRSSFHTLRKKGGLSGFPKMSESVYDSFGTGHSSTSVSAALGYAAAASLQGISREHIAVIGDGALSAGQAFEALNNAALSSTNITVIINDNHIGIDPSQGALGEYLEQIEFRKDNFFQDLGFLYYGPADGHHVEELVHLFRAARMTQVPKIIHIRTVKGKGYQPAEDEKTKWHSTGRFDKISGKNTSEKEPGVRFQEIFGRTLLELAETDEKIVAVTPAMVSGSSLQFLQEKFPQRMFDVGISEQHAVTFSCGLAAAGMTPFCCLYSTFLQRGIDQIIHDAALQKLPVIFAVDRAGLVGEDGPTHHGVFDLAMLQSIPGVQIISPCNQEELRNAMYTAVHEKNGPVVIRYPRGSCGEDFIKTPFKKFASGSSFCYRKESHETVLLSVGTIGRICEEALKGSGMSHYGMRYVKPYDRNLAGILFRESKDIFVVEEVQRTGGFASVLMTDAAEAGYKGRIHSLALPDRFTGHGTVSELLDENGLSSVKIREFIQQRTGRF